MSARRAAPSTASSASIRAAAALSTSAISGSFGRRASAKPRRDETVISATRPYPFVLRPERIVAGALATAADTLLVDVLAATVEAKRAGPAGEPMWLVRGRADVRVRMALLAGFEVVGHDHHPAESGMASSVREHLRQTR